MVRRDFSNVINENKNIKKSGFNSYSSINTKISNNLDDDISRLNRTYIQVYQDGKEVDIINLPIRTFNNIIQLNRQLNKVNCCINYNKNLNRGEFYNDKISFNFDKKKSKYKFYLIIGKDIKLELFSTLELAMLNTINKICTESFSNKGFNYKENRKYLIRFLKIVSNKMDRLESDNLKKLELVKLNETIRLIFNKEFNLQDTRDEKEKRKFSGIYYTNPNKFKSLYNNDYKIDILISAVGVRNGDLIGLAILDDVYLIDDFDNKKTNIRYQDKYNEIMVVLKKYSKLNVKYMLKSLEEVCIVDAYEQERQLIERLVDNNG